jgi:5'-3' exonuclease
MRDEFWDINSLKDMGIDQGEYIACKAICGDPSDNIPSACYGVGEKTALGLYKVYQHSKVITTGFPQDEKALSEICKTLNISKRKAYLDFNEDQFLINMLLMDLSLVQDDITQYVLNMIYDAISVGLGYNNYELCGQLLQNQSINSINMNTLINNINRTKYLAEIDSYEISQNISDIVPQKIGGLF